MLLLPSPTFPLVDFIFSDANSKGLVSSTLDVVKSEGRLVASKSNNSPLQQLDDGDQSEDTLNFYDVSILASTNVGVCLFEAAAPVRNNDLGLLSLPLLYGAKINDIIMAGEWWRLVTAMFLVKYQMRQDYSYSQPSSSDEYARVTEDSEDMQREAHILQDEVESSFIHAEPIQYPPQPDVEFGFSKTCYCAGQPLLATCYTSNEPGRRFFTCENVDGEMHVWKWWDVAVMEEMRDRDTLYAHVSEKVDYLTFLSDYKSHLNQVRAVTNETEQILLNLEMVVGELGKNKTMFRNGFELVVRVMAIVVVLLGMVVMLN